jgi:transposase-like protein
MKKRIRHGDPQRRSYWEEVVRRWREGGQPVRAFCRGEGLRESAFYFWRRRLACRSRRAGAVNGPRSQPHAVTPASHSSQRVSPGGSPSPSFLPLHVVASEGLKPTSGYGLAEAAQGVEIILGPGRTVRVPAGFDRQTLADVLAVLEVRPC